jgi:hypothetical protein
MVFLYEKSTEVRGVLWRPTVNEEEDTPMTEASSDGGHRGMPSPQRLLLQTD